MCGGAEPARRLRRWWSTAMRSAGLGEYESSMGGHSQQVALAHYVDARQVALKAKMPSAHG
jgi:hypothetical protein